MGKAMDLSVNNTKKNIPCILKAQEKFCWDQYAPREISILGLKDQLWLHKIYIENLIKMENLWDSIWNHRVGFYGVYCKDLQIIFM